MLESDVGSHLASLPEELLSNIAVKLGSDDLFAFRLTCRTIEARTLHEFASEYFSAKGFIFTHGSLQVLLNIAESNKFRHYLKHVLLLSAYASERAINCPRRDACCYKPTVRQREAFLGYLADQKQLKESEDDKRFLSVAFSKLPKLDTLSLIDRPPASSIAECHGLRKFKRTTDSSLTYTYLASDDHVSLKESHPWLSHIFRTIMLAIAESGINTLETLRAAPGDHGVCALSPMDLRFKSKTIDALSRSFANLKRFELALRGIDFRPGRRDSSNDPARANKILGVFMKAIPGVHDVKLGFDHAECSSSLCGTLIRGMAKANLTRLALQNLAVDQTSLATIVGGLTSATFVSLEAVDLTTGSWLPILQALRKLLALKHLHMLYLTEAGRKTYFLKQPDPDDDYDLDEDDPYEDWEDEGDESDESSDDDIPALIAEGEEETPSAEDEDEESLTSEEADPSTLAPVNTCKFHTADYASPGARAAGSIERGYYICVQGEEIPKQLGVFEKEYNLGQDAAGADLNAGALFNAMMGIGGLGGQLGPVPFPIGPVTVQAQGSQGAQAGRAAAVNPTPPSAPQTNIPASTFVPIDANAGANNGGDDAAL